MRTVPTIAESIDPTGRRRRLVVRLDADAVVPLYEQLRAQLSVMVAVGHLVAGSRLPTVRDMAYALALAPGTVARSYRELEADGAVEGRGRRGTFVVDEPPHSEPLQQRRERLAAAADRFAFEVRQIGIDRDSSHQALDEALTRGADAERAS